MGEAVSFLRAPDAGNPHVRCDEREQETELCQTGLRRRGESLANRHRETKATAPVLDSTKSDLSTQYPVKTERPGDFATLKLTFLVIMPILPVYMTY